MAGMRWCRRPRVWPGRRFGRVAGRSRKAKRRQTGYGDRVPDGPVSNRASPVCWEKGANPRFVVTSLSPERLGARALYEDFYCARGDMENRIKEQQLDLFADRTSAATMRANQLRLYLSSAAYMLMHALRRLGLKQTTLARAQCQTIRLKLLKIGAQVRLTVRHVWISMSEAYPYSEVFAAVVRNLQAIPLRC